MATATEILTLELESKGITDITRDERFRAWEHVSKYDVDHAVVTRSLAFEQDEQIPCTLLGEIATHKPRAQSSFASEQSTDANVSARPMTTTELKAWPEVRIRECVAMVMEIVDVEEIDSRVPLSDYGVDSVMTIGLRQKLQSSLQAKVPRTLMWNYPTVSTMTDWFLKQLEDVRKSNAHETVSMR
jgi:6-methylsalicylic acid synthase